MRLVEGMLLYHGSYAEVRSVRLDLCAPGKDFGRGFYLTSDEGQARRFIKTSLVKARMVGKADPCQRYGFVSVFRVGSLGGVRQFEFASADEEWLRYIALNRRSSLADRLRRGSDEAVDAADVVIGKVANDTTNAVITTYLNGLYGEVGSRRAAETAIGLLLPERLKDQFCFRTEKAVSCLRFEGALRYDA